MEGILYIFINAICEGMLLALITLGFQMIYGGFKFFDMSAGSTYISSVYFYFLGWFICGKLYITNWFAVAAISYLTSIILTLSMTLFTGMLIYNKFIKKRANELVLMIISLAIYTMIINFLVMFAGNEPQKIGISEYLEKSFVFLGTNYIYTNVLQFAVSLIMIIMFFIIMMKTNLGYKITAISDNTRYFNILGLNPTKTKIIILIISTILINTSALLKTSEIGIVPHTTGFQYMILAAVAMIIGGIDSYLFAVIGSVLLIFVMNITEWCLPDTWGVWKYAVIYIALIMVLIIRPKGLKNIRLRAEE